MSYSQHDRDNIENKAINKEDFYFFEFHTCEKGAMLHFTEDFISKSVITFACAKLFFLFLFDIFTIPHLSEKAF